MKEIFLMLNDFSLPLQAVNILIGIKIFKQRPELKWFEINLIVAFVIQIWMRYLGLSQTNNLFLTHIYVPIEFLSLSLFYRNIFGKNNLFNRYFIPFVGLILTAAVANTLFFEPITVFPGNAKTLTQIIIISYAVIWFFRRLNHEVQENHLLLNRLNAAILVYYSGSLLVFMFTNFFRAHTNIDSLYLWTFNVVIYIVFLLLILFARWRVLYTREEV